VKYAAPRLNPLWGSALGGNSTGQAVTASISLGREVSDQLSIVNCQLVRGFMLKNFLVSYEPA